MEFSLSTLSYIVWLLNSGKLKWRTKRGEFSRRHDKRHRYAN